MVLHLVINEQGEPLAALVTAGNLDDRKPVQQLCQGLYGKVIADKGYINKDLREILQEDSITLIYKVRKNMKPEPLSDVDDIHIISAASDNPNVATVSVETDSVVITGNAAGTTTITVSATDDSGQDNAEAIPVTFMVTVNEPPPPLLVEGSVSLA